mmetsp:Transcript_24103/g.38588  ORF Transcript_24103/g.38588 Transcript_24103/m.38588 type:complete len:200 (+) Transcript_24103:457-1056(+)
MKSEAPFDPLAEATLRDGGAKRGLSAPLSPAAPRLSGGRSSTRARLCLTCASRALRWASATAAFAFVASDTLELDAPSEAICERTWSAPSCSILVCQPFAYSSRAATSPSCTAEGASGMVSPPACAAFSCCSRSAASMRAMANLRIRVRNSPRSGSFAFSFRCFSLKKSFLACCIAWRPPSAQAAHDFRSTGKTGRSSK